MKQHIIIEQLNELSDKGKEKLIQYGRENLELTCFADQKWNNAIASELLLSIGQMIEFLREKAMGDLDLQIWINNAGSSVWTGIGKQENKLGGGEDIELCDALWEVVKEILTIEIPQE